MLQTIIPLLQPSELSAIRTIAADVWPKTFRDILSEEQIRYMMNMMYAPDVMEAELGNGYHFDLLTVDGVPAGYVSYSQYSLPETAKLHKIYLLEKYQGLGLGSGMLEHVAVQCRRLGFRFLRLNVNKHNQKALKAYVRNGYQKIESVKIDIGNGFFMDDYVMQKELKQNPIPE